MVDDELSLQYHSIRLYDGTYTYQNIPYRIGDNRTTVRDEVEHYYDTWKDFHLIPSTRPVVPVPQSKTKFVSIPGRSIPYDLSNYLTGHPTFGNRTGSWSFYTDTDFVDQNGGWVEFSRRLFNLFHGRVYKVVLLDDPSYFYYGELTMSPWSTGDSISTVSISFNFYPYKKALLSSMDMWKWDDFDFQDGVVTYLRDLEVSGSRIVDVYGSYERISPHISGSSGLLIDKYENLDWVSYGEVPVKAISSIDSIIPGLIIDEGRNQIRLRGNGTATIDYRRGLL